MSADPRLVSIELAHEPHFTLGAAEVTPAKLSVRAGARSENLEPRVMQVLVALARERGEVVSREDLIQSCWAGRVVGEDAIHRCIGRLRRLAGQLGGFEIETVPRVGYRLSERGSQASPPEGPSRPSVAVLPFANMSGDTEQAYFSDGITEDIITDLSKVSALFVVARNSTFTFKGRNVDVRQVAQELGVSHVLEGSVRKADGRVRITAQLNDGATGGHIWAERYDRDVDDIFALQDEISRQVVAALKLRLLPEERKAIETRGTRSAAAYDLYLMAKKQYVTGDQGDPDWGETIVRLSRRATEIDPNYADAWAWLALGQVGSQSMHGGAGDRGLAAAEHALALNPNLGLAYAVKARIFLDTGRHTEADREITNALRLAADSSVVNYQAGLVHYYQRRFADALGYFEAAQTLDDTDFNASAFALGCYDKMGDRTASIRTAKILLSHVEKVLAEDRNNSLALATGGRALAVLGQAERAREWMDRALLIRPDNYVVRFSVAVVLAAILQEPEAALDALALALPKMTANFFDLVTLTDYFATIRAHPRFKAMMSDAQARLANAKPDPPS